MTPRSFWIVVIKIIGVCIFYMSITTVWHTISSILAYTSIIIFVKEYSYPNYVTITAISCLVLFLLYVFMAYCFIFKTNWIVNKLKLDKGYEDERFEINFHESTILRIAVIIISGLLLINVIPGLFSEIIYYFHEPGKYEKFEHNRNNGYIIADTVKIIIGLLLLFYNTAIVRFIERKEKKSVIENNPE